MFWAVSNQGSGQVCLSRGPKSFGCLGFLSWDFPGSILRNPKGTPEIAAAFLHFQNRVTSSAGREVEDSLHMTSWFEGCGLQGLYVPITIQLLETRVSLVDWVFVVQDFLLHICHFSKKSFPGDLRLQIHCRIVEKNSQGIIFAAVASCWAAGVLYSHPNIGFKDRKMAHIEVCKT